MPMIPETVALFLACAKIGAIIVPLFSGFGAGAIVSRLRMRRQGSLHRRRIPRRGDPVALKPTADEAARHSPPSSHIVVVRRDGQMFEAAGPRRLVSRAGGQP